MEMHLISLCDQVVRVAGQVFEFKRFDNIHTENSYKYSVEQFQELASAAGFNPVKVWTDREQLFSLHYFS
jgi:uncharacterized SAM-dependent methyltransferase